MEQRKSIPSGDPNNSSSAGPNKQIQGLQGPDRGSGSEQEGGDSWRSKPVLADKADAILKEELHGRSNQNTPLIPGGFNQDLMDLTPNLEQLRQQAYKLVDTFLQMLKDRPELLTQFVSQFSSIERPLQTNVALPFPLLKVPLPVNAGEIGHIPISLINDDPKDTLNHALHTTDLVNASGHKISADHINVSSNRSKVLPGESVDEQIEIRIPPGTPPGIYSGLLQAEESTVGQTVIQVTVAP